MDHRRLSDAGKRKLLSASPAANHSDAKKVDITLVLARRRTTFAKRRTLQIPRQQARKRLDQAQRRHEPGWDIQLSHNNTAGVDPLRHGSCKNPADLHKVCCGEAGQLLQSNPQLLVVRLNKPQRILADAQPAGLLSCMDETPLSSAVERTHQAPLMPWRRWPVL